MLRESNITWCFGWSVPAAIGVDEGGVVVLVEEDKALDS